MDKEISKINAQKEKKHSNDESLKDPETIESKEILFKEQGGPKGPEPTRYGDWEKSGRCSDF